MSTLPMITESDLKTVHTLADMFIKSTLFPDTKSLSQAAVKILAGRELGMGPFESMRDINIIQGKTTLAGAQVAARIKQSGDYDYEIITFDAAVCVLRFTRQNKALKPDISFSLDDAKRLGLAGRDNYTKQARTMLFWRALTMGARMHCPHIFGGSIYTPDEIRSGAIDVTPTPEPHEFKAGTYPAVQHNGANGHTEPEVAPLPYPGEHEIEGTAEAEGKLESLGLRIDSIPADRLQRALKSPRIKPLLSPADKVNIEAYLEGQEALNAARAQLKEQVKAQSELTLDYVPDFSEGSSD